MVVELVEPPGPPFATALPVDAASAATAIATTAADAKSRFNGCPLPSVHAAVLLPSVTRRVPKPAGDIVLAGARVMTPDRGASRPWLNAWRQPKARSHSRRSSSR